MYGMLYLQGVITDEVLKQKLNGIIDVFNRNYNVYPNIYHFFNDIKTDDKQEL